MDYSSRPQEQIRDHHHHHHQKPPPSSPYSPLNSPTSNGSTNNNNNNGVQTPTTPKLMTPRSTDPNNPYATTFVQADSSNFKHVVQMLTGSSETTTSTKHHHHHPSSPNNINKDPSFSSSSSPLSKNFTIPPVKTAGAKKPQQQQGFKLYERRSQNLKNSLMINTLMPNFHHHHHHRNSNSNSPRHHQILSPSVLDFPALTLSPVTPLLNDEHCSPMGNSSSEEDRAIAEKGFYLHPSPRSNNNTPREPEPRLLPLFPVTSPGVSGSTSTTS